MAKFCRVGIAYRFRFVQLQCCGINTYEEFTKAASWDRNYVVTVNGHNVTLTAKVPLSCCKFDFTSFTLMDINCTFTPTTSNSNIDTVITNTNNILRTTRYCYTTSRPSICLSVCPSVTLTYHDHVRWNTSKNNFMVGYLECSLSADPSIYSKENTRNFSRNRARVWKSGFRRIKALIFLKRGKITNYKLQMTA